MMIQDILSAHVAILPFGIMNQMVYAVSEWLLISTQGKFTKSKEKIVMNKKVLGICCAAAMMLISSMSVFASSPDSDKILQNLTELGNETGFTVTEEESNESDGNPVYLIDGISVSEFDQAIAQKGETLSRSTKVCSHNWYYYWTAIRENCYNGSGNSHTFQRQLQECLVCTKIMSTGEVRITNCPSGCRA